MATPAEVFSAVTIANYVREKWDNYVRYSPVFGLLEKLGNIRKNLSGTSVVWPVWGGWYNPVLVSPYQDITDQFVPRRMTIQATLNWGEVMVADAIDKGEFARNTGDAALIQIRDYRIPMMAEALIASPQGDGGLAYQFLNKDGALYTGNGLPLYGMPSIFDNASFPARLEDDSGALASSGQKWGMTKRTYANQPCARSGLASIIDGAEVDAWSAKIGNTTASAFGSAATFRGNCFTILSESFQKVTFDPANPKFRPTCAIMDSGMFNDLRYNLDGKQTIFVQGKVDPDEKFGVGNSVEMAYHDGVPCYWDMNQPTGTTYITNFYQIWLDCLRVPEAISADRLPGKKTGLRDDMFDVEAMYNDGRRGATISITVRPQFRINPKYQLKLAAFG